MYRSSASANLCTRPMPAPIGERKGLESAASIWSSTSSASLCPPAAKNLIPLSGAGLWDAEIITPKSAFISAVRKAVAGVGTTPASNTSTPEDASPAATAAAKYSPEILGSRPMTAIGLLPSLLACSPNTDAAA